MESCTGGTSGSRVKNDHRDLFVSLKFVTFKRILLNRSSNYSGFLVQQTIYYCLQLFERLCEKNGLHISMKVYNLVSTTVD